MQESSFLKKTSVSRTAVPFDLNLHLLRKSSIKGDFVNSKLNYLSAYKIRKLRKDSRGLAKINNNLANIYEKTNQYKAAMASFIEALSYFESIKDEKNIGIIKGNIGLIHLKLKNYPKITLMVALVQARSYT